MKKLGIFVAVMAISASVYASSLAIPWFVDNAPAANNVPGNSPGVTGLIILKSNRTDDLVCTIDYFNAEGAELGPFTNNTFVIPALASLSFRPVATDPSTVNGGQESAAAVLVPNRPVSVDANTPIPGTNPPVIDRKKNGSATVSWNGGTSDVQGLVTYFQTAVDPTSGATVTFSYGSLLPQGF